MPMVRTMALVLRGADTTETSRVLTLFTREMGKISAMAKGARRLKSPFQCALDVLSVCDIVLIHKASDALDLLTEATLEERFASLGRDMNALSAGYHIAELLAELTDRDDPHPRLFDAARITLRHLGEAELRPHRLIRFELACLRELGHAPALDECVHCGGPVESRGREGVAFGLSLGGVFCPECRPGQPHVAVLTGATLESLRWLAAPGGAWRDLDLSGGRLGPLRGVLGAVFSHLMGRRPAMLPYLGGD
jgi:DNA repair protein RecO (recombination protein O)